MRAVMDASLVFMRCLSGPLPHMHQLNLVHFRQNSSVKNTPTVCATSELPRFPPYHRQSWKEKHPGPEAERQAVVVGVLRSNTFFKAAPLQWPPNILAFFVRARKVAYSAATLGASRIVPQPLFVEP
jgi:hypothetical protein